MLSGSMVCILQHNIFNGAQEMEYNRMALQMWRLASSIWSLIAAFDLLFPTLKIHEVQLRQHTTQKGVKFLHGNIKPIEKHGPSCPM